MRGRRALRGLVFGAAAAMTLAAGHARAQGLLRLDLGGDLLVGGEGERYLRALQLAGLMRAQPWQIRPVFAKDRSGFVVDSVHPWQDRWEADSVAHAPAHAPAWRLLRPGARLVYNSAFPFQRNDGPAWMGRGLTGVLQGGLTARLGRVHLQIAPVVFLAQNQEFPLAPNGLTGDRRFRDARFRDYIDAPQRFGAAPWGRIDPGNSTLSVDVGDDGIVGVSTAAQSWGPAQDYPLLLGASSGGFPHVFAATKQPLNLGILGLHTRLIAGRLSQTPWSPDTVTSGKRWAAAIAVVIVPHGIDGLEFGLARFIEGISERGIPTPRRIARLFSGGLSGMTGLEIPRENQLASAFFRWELPHAGVEFYGEYLREDYSFDLRRFLQYPDDYASYVIGLQHVLRSAQAGLRTLRIEVMNAEVSPSNRGERGDKSGTNVLQGPMPPYFHASMLQGHTNRGLFLGSPEAFGGAGWRVSVDQFDSRGRLSLSLERSLRLDWLFGMVPGATVHPDVLWGVRAEVMRFSGTRDYTVSVEPMIDLNRNLRQGNDVFNLRLAASVRGLR